MLQKVLVIFLRLVLHVGGDIAFLDLDSLIVKIIVSLHLDKVDNSDKICFCADRKLYRNGICLEPVVDLIDDAIKVRAHDIHLVDIAHTGHAVFIRLPPNGFGLRFDATLGAENGDGAVQHAERAFDFNGEVDMTRRVDNVYAMVLPEAGRCGGGNGYPALLFLLHPVHRCGAVVCFADLVRFVGIEKDSFRCGCLARVDMSHYADITGELKRSLSGHIFLL